MDESYKKLNLIELRDLLWSRQLVPKKWMLTFIKRAEALYLLANIKSVDEFPQNFQIIITERCSKRRRRMYQSKKDRSLGHALPPNREERLRLVMNSAKSLVFSRVTEPEGGFISYLGSKKGKVSFEFVDDYGVVYKFTRSEVEKLSSMGLFIPRGTLSRHRNKLQTPAKRACTLKAIFED